MTPAGFELDKPWPRTVRGWLTFSAGQGFWERNFRGRGPNPTNNLDTEESWEALLITMFRVAQLKSQVFLKSFTISDGDRVKSSPDQNNLCKTLDVFVDHHVSGGYIKESGYLKSFNISDDDREKHFWSEYLCKT